MMFDVKPNKAKNPQEMRHKIWQDNRDIAEKTTGQEDVFDKIGNYYVESREKEDREIGFDADEFFVGMGLEPGNKKADIKNGIPAKRPKEEDFFDYYKKSNNVTLNKYAYPSQEMISQKENDLPGYTDRTAGFRVM